MILARHVAATPDRFSALLEDGEAWSYNAASEVALGHALAVLA